MKPLKMPRLDFLVAALNSRSEREKQLIIGFVVVLVVVLDYMLFLAPVLGTFSKVPPKLGPLREEVRGLVEDAQSKDEIRVKWEQAKRLIELRGKALIAPDETPALLENLSQQAQRSGVKIVSLQPLDSARGSGKSTFTPLPISMKAMAGAHEFGAFLSSLETGSTLFCVKDLRINSNSADDRKHQIELSMEAYKRETPS